MILEEDLYADVIRIVDTEENLLTGILKDKMLSMTTDTHKIIYRVDDFDGIIKHKVPSEDSDASFPTLKLREIEHASKPQILNYDLITKEVSYYEAVGSTGWTLMYDGIGLPMAATWVFGGSDGKWMALLKTSAFNEFSPTLNYSGGVYRLTVTTENFGKAVVIFRVMSTVKNSQKIAILNYTPDLLMGSSNQQIDHLAYIKYTTNLSNPMAGTDYIITRTTSNVKNHNYKIEYLENSNLEFAGVTDITAYGSYHDVVVLDIACGPTPSKYLITQDDVTSTREVISTVTAGAIEPLDVVVSGVTLTEFIEQLLIKTYYPTYVAPTAALTSSISSSVESGTIANNLLTLTLSRGSILGDIVGGVWVPTQFQNYRAGIASNYTINGVDRDLVNTLTLTSYGVVDGANTWSGLVEYTEGSQPLDSNNDAFETPLAAGSLAPSVTIYGRRKAIYGTDAVSATPYTLSSQVRLLSGSLLNPANGSTFTISIPIGALQVVFAYPATLENVSTVKYVEGLNAEVKNIFTQTTISVDGANGYSAVSYKVYTYVPAVAFPATATYNVTI